MTDSACWPNRFVGLPFAPHGRSRHGADCWGLVCVVYAEARGIVLPSYAGYTSVDELSEIHALVAGATASPIWQPVAVQDAGSFDVVVFRRGTLASHLGLVIRPGLMLHMAAEDCAKVEGYASGRWRHRLVGHFRWVGPGRGAA